MGEFGRKTSQGRASAINLQHLRFVVVAADSGSLRRAAELLAIRHSVLSRSIAQLEHLVGTPLFERSRGGVKLTPAGRDLLRIARLILEQVDLLVSTGRSLGSGEAGQLSIGFSTSISTGNLRSTLLEFKNRFPDVRLMTVERSRVHLANALRSGTVDIVVSPAALLQSDGRLLPLWSERILVSLPANHPLLAREAIYWIDLRNETILLSKHDPGRELEDILVSKFLFPAERPKIEHHDASRGIVRNLTSMGLGVGLVLESDLGTTHAGLAYRELRDGMGPSRIGFYAHWQSNNGNPALERFVKLLTERYPSTAPVFEK